MLPLLLSAAGFLILGCELLVAADLLAAVLLAAVLLTDVLLTAALTVLTLLVLVRPMDVLLAVILPVPVLLPVTDFLEPYQTSFPLPAIPWYG